MNPLIAILPNIRDLRLPTATGVAWLIVGWCALPLIPVSWFDFLALAQAGKAINNLGPGAQGATFAVVVYLLGIVFSVMDPLLRILPNIFHSLIWAGIFLAIVYCILFLLEFTAPYILGLVAIMVILRVSVFGISKHLLGDTRDFSTILADDASRLGRFADRSARRGVLIRINIPILRGAAVRASQLDYLCATVDDYVLDNPDRLASVIDHLDDDDLQVFLRQAERLSGAKGLTRATIRGLRLKAKNWRLSRVELEAETRTLLREHLLRMILSNPIARRRFLANVLNLARWRELLSVEMRDMPAVLQVRHPTVYEDWDRLDSEASLRQRLATPIFYLGLILVVRDVDWSAISIPRSEASSNWPQIAFADIHIGHILVLLACMLINVLLTIDATEKAYAREMILISALRTSLIEATYSKPKNIEQFFEVLSD